MSIKPYTHTIYVNIVNKYDETVIKMRYVSSSKSGARRKANRFLAGTYTPEQIEEAIVRDIISDDFDVWNIYKKRLTTPV